MDDNFQEILDSLPKKRSRSRLELYCRLIDELLRRGWTSLRIPSGSCTEGGRVPMAAWTPENTVLLGVAQARDFEFEAKYLGDWMLHCHLPHHMMNQMASMVGPLAHAGSGIEAGRRRWRN